MAGLSRPSPPAAPAIIRRLAHSLVAALVMLAIAGAGTAQASAHHGAVHRITGVPLHSGATAFHLGHVRVAAVISARVTLRGGRRLTLRLRRLRAGARRGIVRLRLGAHRRAVLTLRTDGRRPAAPRRLAATAGDGRVRLHWSRPAGDHPHGYRILHGGRRVATTRGATTKTLTGLPNGHPYAVRVVAVDGAGNVSPASSPVAVTPQASTAAAETTIASDAGPAGPKAEPLAASASAVNESPAAPAPAIVCDRYAASSGNDSAAGTAAAPFATAQRLFDALSAGQTGCLRGGTYRQSELRASHSGTPGAPITLASAPGEQARIVVDTDVYFPAGTTDIAMRNLAVTNNPASTTNQAVMIQDHSDRSLWDGNDISANSLAHCMELGWAGHATAHGSIIRRNRIHDCGNPATGNQEHSIYVAQTVDATITQNVFWHASAFTIHLYPSADHTLVTHNVIVDSGWGGVIFASDQDPGTGRVSDDNTVAYNVITGGARYGLDVFWGASGVGSGNSAHHNCISGNAAGAMPAMPAIAISDTATAPVTYVDAATHDYRLAPGDPCLRVVGFDAAAQL